MAQLVYFKETLIYFYKKHADVLFPMFKFIFSLLSLCIVSNMFQYNDAVNKMLIFLPVSAVQAFLPWSFLYFTTYILIMMNLWKVSMDILLGFFLFFVICWLVFARVEMKYAVIAVITTLTFALKIEYILPVLLGLTVGFGSILPAAMGTVVYFLSGYMADVSTLLTTSAASSFGMGLQRILSLLFIDKKLLVLLISFSLIIFITSLLCKLFYERAWLFAVIVGNIALALLLLFGRLIFELDYSIWRVFLEIIVGIICCFIYRFFRGIGDVSRIERVSFEDDDYFYYVKAVPKIKVAQKDRNVTNILSGEETEQEDIMFDNIMDGEKISGDSPKETTKKEAEQSD